MARGTVADILKIDNLITFTNLVKLQLDNNLIESIENIDHLTQLRWLDLSFNNIERIQGLEKLVHITDLSLHHNQIEVLEGLDSLTKLDVLSIGDNLLEWETPHPGKDIAHVLYLRKFSHLRSLNLAGNPMCEDPAYEEFTVAFLPALRYIDWRRISDETRLSATHKYQDALDIEQIKEKNVADQLAQEQGAAAKAEMYAEARVPEMYGNTLFQKLLDPEIKKLFPIPEVVVAVSSFEDKFNGCVEVIGSQGLANSATRAKERGLFFEALAAGKEENRQRGIAAVETFLKRKNKLVLESQQLVGAQAALKLETAQNELQALKMELMELEMGLVASIEESASLFSRSYNELVSKAVEEFAEKMTEMREAEDVCFKSVNDIAVAFLDKQIKGELTEGVVVTDELLMLLRDKATLQGAIVTAHDNHVMVIDAKEDQLLTGIKKEEQALVDDQAEAEATRNRERVAEIIHFVNHHAEDLDTQLEEC